MAKTHITEYDVFYISFDEPEREKNWANLLTKFPWAQRVHGVKGFDAAHKKCAELSQTDRFITVDGDTIVHDAFTDIEMDIPDHLADCTFSWASVNYVNGLIYGNGGLKLWTKDFVNNMRTHEHKDVEGEESKYKLDFCWDSKYIQMNNVYSTTKTNGSPYQAFRAAFREGVKMTLHDGNLVDPQQLEERLHAKNFKRLLTWLMIGADVENGLWSVLGARMGMAMTLSGEFDLANISSYDWFTKFWKTKKFNELTKDGYSEDLHDLIMEYGDEIQLKTGIWVPYFDAHQSEMFKRIADTPVRSLNPLVTEIEVINGRR